MTVSCIQRLIHEYDLQRACTCGVSRETTPYFYPVFHLSDFFFFILNNHLFNRQVPTLWTLSTFTFCPVCFELMYHRPASRVSLLLFSLKFPVLWDVKLRRGAFPDISKERPIHADQNPRFNLCGNF
jgi:hypothetical protein